MDPCFFVLVLIGYYVCIIVAVYGYKKGERYLFYQAHIHLRYGVVDHFRCMMWAILATTSPLLPPFCLLENIPAVLVGPLVVFLGLLCTQRTCFVFIIPEEMRSPNDFFAW